MTSRRRPSRYRAHMILIIAVGLFLAAVVIADRMGLVNHG